MTLEVGSSYFAFQPHPLLPAEMGEVYVIEGGEALIYQVREEATGNLYALKVSKPSNRGPHIARSVEALLPYADLPGLALGRRLCLTQNAFPRLIAAFPDLQYAVVMPWLTGRTWAGFMADRAASAGYTPSDALALAAVTAQVLWDLEAHHLAHTDIAGGNVVITPDSWHAELLDIESLYIPHAPTPPYVSRGTPGYQLPHVGKQGNWCAAGDRFAGAILLTEMLAWADPIVRVATPDGADSLFQQSELQWLDVPRWQAARDALWALCPPLLALFDQAWAATTLEECAELGSWALALAQIPA
jgi:hypothetical protein